MMMQLAKRNGVANRLWISPPRHRPSPSRQSGRPARSEAHTQTVVIGDGGAGCSVLPVLGEMCPELLSNMLGVDCDMQIEALLGARIRHFHLSSGGDLGAILANRRRYSYLRENALPVPMATFYTEQGVGRIRLATSVLLAYNLESLRMNVRRFLEQTLARFRGPLPKRLIVHVVFSLCGGSGSALAIPLTSLLISMAKSIAKSLQITVIAHAMSPSLFISKLDTPADVERTLANGAMTLRELKLAQRPEGLRKLCQALSIPPLDRPVFDDISFYDLADSGNSAGELEDAWDLVAANIAASANQPLTAREGSRDINQNTAQRGNGKDCQGTAVVRSEHSTVIRIPADKLAAAFAAQTVAKELEKLVHPATGHEAQGLLLQHLPALGFDVAHRAAFDQLRPDASYHLPVSLHKMADDDVRRIAERCSSRWMAKGRSDLERKGVALADSFETAATQRADRFVAEITSRATSAPVLAAALRGAVEKVEERKAGADSELEALARKDTEDGYRMAGRNLQQAFRFLPHGGVRSQIGRAVNDLIETAVKQEAVRLYRDRVLAPTLTRLYESLEVAERTHQALDVVRHQAEFQVEECQSSIGYQNEYYDEILSPDEMRAVLEQMAREVPARMGGESELHLADLLRAAGEDAVRDLVGEAGRHFQDRAGTYLRQYIKDLAGFVKHFKLDFDVDEWLREALTVTLPAKLNLAVHGPGNFPVRSYVVAADSMRSASMDVVAQTGNAQAFEFCPGDNAFEIIVRAKVSRAPFSSIPGLEEMERYYHEFLRGAPTDHVWGVLISHGALMEAAQQSLLDSDSDE